MTATIKPAKTQPPKGKNGKKAVKPKKPMPKFMVAVWCFVAFLFLLAGAGYCLYANVGGVAEKALVLLPQYKASLAGLETREAELAQREKKLQDGNDKLKKDRDALDKQAAGLAAREEKLKQDKTALDERLKQAQTAEEKRQAIVEVYCAMDPSDAAERLDKAATLQDAAAVLKLLPNDTKAAILAEMDPKKAFDLTKLLMQ